MAQVSFKVKDERLALIDRAATIDGFTRTEFVMRASEAAAIEILNERPLISLDEDGYSAFLAALDTPREPGQDLQDLMNRTPLWEK